MSRNVDLTKPLNKQDPYDIRYALDRNLISDPEERRRAFAFLNGHPDAVDGGDDEEEGMDPSKHKVKDVISWAESDDVSAEEVEAVLEMERAAEKPRTSLIEALEAMLEPDEGEGDEGDEES